MGKSSLVKWVTEEHGVTSFEEFEEKFEIEEVVFNATVYSLFSLEWMEAEATNNINYGEIEYQVTHKDSNIICYTGFEDLNDLHIELSQ